MVCSGVVQGSRDHRRPRKRCLEGREQSERPLQANCTPLVRAPQKPLSEQATPLTLDTHSGAGALAGCLGGGFSDGVAVARGGCAVGHCDRWGMGWDLGRLRCPRRDPASSAARGDMQALRKRAVCRRQAADPRLPRAHKRQRPSPTCDRGCSSHCVCVARADGLGDGCCRCLGVTLGHSISNGGGLSRGVLAEVAVVRVCGRRAVGGGCMGGRRVLLVITHTEGSCRRRAGWRTC